MKKIACKEWIIPYIAVNSIVPLWVLFSEIKALSSSNYAIVFGSIVLSVIELACWFAILFHPIRNYFMVVKIDDNGISNKYITISWEEMKDYGYAYNKLMYTPISVERAKDFATLMLFGEKTSDSFRRLDPKKSVWLVNTRKNIEMLEKYSNGKWNKYN